MRDPPGPGWWTTHGQAHIQGVITPKYIIKYHFRLNLRHLLALSFLSTINIFTSGRCIAFGVYLSYGFGMRTEDQLDHLIRE